MNPSETGKSKLEWLGTPWTYLVLAILTWPLYIAVVALCLRFHLSVWIVNVSAFILVFMGMILSAATWHAAWRHTHRQRLFILVGSVAAWFVAGRIFYYWFGYLIREVSR
jgi:hypothetical protein